MAAIRWQLSIGIIIVIDMLWWHCYDIYTLAALLWRLCFGGYTLAAMLWRQSCHGNKLQKATDILIHTTITTIIVITTVTTITTITTITIIYSCLQPIQRFSRTEMKVLLCFQILTRYPKLYEQRKPDRQYYASEPLGT